ncbi:DUF2179 domain-containing protein [Bacteroidales bacterium OttesenSCG-928-I21]|nr:DUF2179 domain-containing protein [Bacteroidales bacterium OttesenSCG-928-I21]
MLFEMPDTFAFAYIILPILIFCARICDVTLGTLRIIFVSKGFKTIAPLLGFFEVFIWVIAISQLLSSFSSWVCYVAYAAGFAAGNYVGMLIEERIAIGTLLVRITTPKDARGLVKMMSEKGFGATLVEGEGSKGKVTIVQSIVSRKSIKDIQDILDNYDQNLFYTIEDVRSVTRGVFPTSKSINSRWRPGK